MKAKVAGILLMFCLVAPVASTYVYLQVQKKQVKRAVKWKMIAGLEKQELVLLKFTASDAQSQLRWEHAKEFEYQGQMYDVAEKTMNGDTTYYWCWWDHEETKLNKQLGGLVANALGQNPERRDKQDKVVDFFKKLYNEPYQDPLAPPLRFQSVNFNCFTSLQQVYFTPPAPPPRQS